MVPDITYSVWAIFVQSCERRTGLPYINASAGHQIRLNSIEPGCDLINDKIKCRGSRTLVSARQRWWYMAVSRCSQDVVREDISGMRLDFELTMTNGDGLFFKHFSADEHCKQGFRM